MVSLASYDFPVSYLRHPPPPFHCALKGNIEDLDQDELPDVKDIISDQYSVLIDVTGGPDNEVCHCAHKIRTITNTDFLGHVEQRSVSPRLPTIGLRDRPY